MSDQELMARLRGHSRSVKKNAIAFLDSDCRFFVYVFSTAPAVARLTCRDIAVVYCAAFVMLN